MLIDDLMVMQIRELEHMYQTLTWGLFHVHGAVKAVLAWYKPNLILSGRSHEDKYYSKNNISDMSLTAVCGPLFCGR